MSPARRILAITGGHRVDLDAFLGMISAICEERGWVWAHAVQPAAQSWLRPEHAGTWDAILCHDLPGLHLRRGSPPEPAGPDKDDAEALVELLQAGQGVVALHHALAGWPAWEGWGEALGGRFFYAPGRLGGRDWPASGTRVTDYTLRIAAPDHPVCEGVTDFRLSDELYCCPVLPHRVVPLLRAEADLDRRLFVSAYEHVLHGEDAAPDCAAHPPTGDLVGWATMAGRSPVVVLQPGDSGATFRRAGYRRLLANALAWVSSPEAHTWSAADPFPISPP